MGLIFLPKVYFELTKDGKGKSCGIINCGKKTSYLLYSKEAALMFFESMLKDRDIAVSKEEKLAVKDAIERAPLRQEVGLDDLASADEKASRILSEKLLAVLFEKEEEAKIMTWQ